MLDSAGQQYGMREGIAPMCGRVRLGVPTNKGYGRNRNSVLEWFLCYVPVKV